MFKLLTTLRQTRFIRNARSLSQTRSPNNAGSFRLHSVVGAPLPGARFYSTREDYDIARIRKKAHPHLLIFTQGMGTLNGQLKEVIGQLKEVIGQLNEMPKRDEFAKLTQKVDGMYYNMLKEFGSPMDNFGKVPRRFVIHTMMLVLLAVLLLLLHNKAKENKNEIEELKSIIKTLTRYSEDKTQKDPPVGSCSNFPFWNKEPTPEISDKQVENSERNGCARESCTISEETKAGYGLTTENRETQDKPIVDQPNNTSSTGPSLR